ncbi:MAG: DNA polymerase III subunit alpha, partial [Thermomicrobiales bacterium]
REEAAKIRGYEQSGSRAFLPPGRGRGSAVSSVICYLIGLSPVDPLRHNLYIGRFLNEEMTSIPDIDIDFPREIRAAMIERIREEYGVEHAAVVGAFATYRLPSAVRDIGKALGMDPLVIDRVARLCEHRKASALGEELAKLPEFAGRLDVPPWSSLIALAEQLSGFPRHMTQHSGGIVISSQRLDELVPIQPAAMEGRSIIQWDKDTVNDLGIIKIDFLALGMLSQVEECLSLIDDHRTDAIDLSRIDYDDPAVFAMIQEGDTIGTFQIESRAQIQMIRRTLPASLDDLVVQVAIVRPGPIIGGAVTPFVERRRDPYYEPTYDHPSLEPVLKETLGVVLYQEQVIQVAEVIAGFTAGQADQLRRAMTKKRSAEAMAAMREQFLAGAAGRGIGPELAGAMFAKLEGFASYGFPKSHAAAFALLAYQTSWLKHSYPAEFLCALLNNQPMGFYQPHILINDAKRHGIRVLRPDINDSMARCSVEGRRTVRIGLMMVKAVSEEVAGEIIRERLRGGPYRSLSDLFRRIPLRRDVLEALIAAGACDRFGLQRREMLWQVGLFIPDRAMPAGRKRRKTTGRQLAFELPTEQDMTPLPPTTAWYRVEEAYRVLGFSLAQHPIALLRHQLPSGMATAADLETMPNGMPVALPGLVAVRQRPETAKGITFMLLEDETGLFNVIVYPDLYERQRLAVRGVPFLIVEGRLQKVQNNINIIATNLTPIDRHAVEPGTTRDWQEHQDDRHEEADVRTLVFVHDDA